CVQPIDCLIESLRGKFELECRGSYLIASPGHRRIRDIGAELGGELAELGDGRIELIHFYGSGSVSDDHRWCDVGRCCRGGEVACRWRCLLNCIFGGRSWRSHGALPHYAADCANL